MMVKEFDVSKGCDLLARWQAGDPLAKARLKDIFDAAIAGEFDTNFAQAAPQEIGRAHV